MLLFAIVVSVIALVEAFFLAKRKGVPRFATSNWRAPIPDPGRYQVVFHFEGQTHELYHGYDGLKARHAFESAPMEMGVTAEFYEWGQKRGSKSA